MMPSMPEPALQLSSDTSERASPQLESLVHDVRILLDELQWYLSRDWQQILRNPAIAKALIRRSTKDALLSEDIRAKLIHYLKYAWLYHAFVPVRGRLRSSKDPLHRTMGMHSRGTHDH